jgi:predicted permease
VGTLAIAIGANATIFSIVDGVLLRPLPFGNGSRLVAVASAVPDGVNRASLPDLRDWREQSHRLDAFASYGLASATLTGRGLPERLDAAVVSGNWFSILGVTPQSGRVFTPDDDQPQSAKVAVVSDGFWRSHLGASPAALGQTLDLDGDAYTIVGVAPPRFTYPGTPQLWVPEILTPAAFDQAQRSQHFHSVIGRLAPGITLGQARQEFTTIVERLRAQYPKADGDVHYTLDPLQDAVVGSVRPALLVLSGAVACVLLIACANVTNLLLVRASARARETAVRIAIGGGRGRIVQGLVVEGAVLAFAGAAIGLALAWAAVRDVVATKLAGLPRLDDIALGGRTVAFAVIIATLASALFGLVPALDGWRRNWGEALKSGTRGGTARGAGVRGTLVIIETAVAVVLLIGATLFARSFGHLLDVDLGFQPQNLIAIDVNFNSTKYVEWSRVRTFVHAVRERLAALPGTRATAYGRGVPFSGFPDSPVPFTIDGVPLGPDQQLVAHIQPVSSGYFAAVGMPMRAGREFTEDDRSSGRRVLVINEAAARRFFPAGDAIGRHLVIDVTADTTGRGDMVHFGGDIVGIVADARIDDLTSPSEPTLYQPHNQVSRAATTFLLRTTADPAAAIAAAGRAIADVDPDVPIARARTLTAAIGVTLARPRLYAGVVGAIALIATLLAIVGIYSVLEFAVRERRRELGIRIAVGARPLQVVGMVVRYGLALAGVGLVLGCTIALSISHVLDNLLFGVRRSDPATYALVSLALLVIAALASWLPGRQAAAVDPLTVMRSE